MKKKFIYLILFFVILVVGYSVATPILPNQICWDFYETGREFCIKHHKIAHSLSVDGSLNVSGDINLSGYIGGLFPVKVRGGLNVTGNVTILGRLNATTSTPNNEYVMTLQNTFAGGEFFQFKNYLNNNIFQLTQTGSGHPYFKMNDGAGLGRLTIAPGDTDMFIIERDNKKLTFGNAYDSKIWYDGTNLIIDTNATGNGIAWFSSNISTKKLIERTPSAKDYSGDYLNFIKSPDEMLDLNYKLKREDMLFGEAVTYSIKDINDCWNETFYDKFSGQNEIVEECGTKLEEGVSPSQVSLSNRLLISELKQENQMLKDCIATSKDFIELKECILKECIK